MVVVYRKYNKVRTIVFFGNIPLVILRIFFLLYFFLKDHKVCYKLFLRYPLNTGHPVYMITRKYELKTYGKMLLSRRSYVSITKVGWLHIWEYLDPKLTSASPEIIFTHIYWYNRRNDNISVQLNRLRRTDNLVKNSDNQHKL